MAFGKPLAAQGTIQADIAESRIEIEQTRLLVLKAAHIMDLYGNKVRKYKTNKRLLHSYFVFLLITPHLRNEVLFTK